MIENSHHKLDVMEKVKLRVGDLRPGMYVCELDRPWLETPFLLQGFEINNDQDIAEIAKYCKHAYIDLMRTKVINVTIDAMTSGSYLEKKNNTIDKKDLDAAENTRKVVFDAMRAFSDDIRFGQSPELELIKAPVSECVSSIIGNPEIMMFMTRLHNRDGYLSQHAFNVCIFSIVLGRLIGLDKKQLQTLGTCGLLHDIGILTIPEHILGKPGDLSERETSIMQAHTINGRDILLSGGLGFSDAANVACTHHEYLDGSGYPNNLGEHHISLYCKIVSIVNIYEAITNPRPSRPAGDHLSAVAILNQMINEHKIDKDLSLHFISYLGIYPQGTIVELNSGEVGIVLGTNQTQRLRPQILIVRNSAKHPTEAFVDLAEKTIDDKGRPYRISHVCKPGDFGINLSHYSELLLESFK